ncbi:hypothetical protein ACGFYT_06905 [Streptomyces sp. NPDC048208]|uniref:hypothetical protein n=1 Tax=unclassified Streptomyces TaxID=2593676 RepID=UPI0033C27284
MAKNKNRKQTGPKNRSSQAEQAQRTGEQSEAQETTAQIAGGQQDYAQRQNKRFGHN